MAYVDKMSVVMIISEKFNLPICDVYNALLGVPSITDMQEPTIGGLKGILDRTWSVMTNEQKKAVLFDEGACVGCGVSVPEGRQICPNCESEVKR